MFCTCLWNFERAETRQLCMCGLLNPGWFRGIMVHTSRREVDQGVE